MKAYDKIPKWNELIFREPTLEENKKCAKRKCVYEIENLPEYNEEVIVTDGINVWIDVFDEAISGEIQLCDTGWNVDEVTAWLPLPKPYKR